MTPETAAHAALDRLCPPGPVGVALSGGSDSTALLLLAAGWRAGQVRAATVDHRLRPAGAAEARACARLCAAEGVDHDILPWMEAPGTGNLQAAAREARLDLLSAWAGRHGLAAILLGHTRDDQAETVLLRLARGSGVDGLSGMAEARRARGVLWVRPLLGLDRAALRSWLTARGTPWLEDPSNEDPRFDRVRVRRALEVLAPLGIDAAGLAVTADRLRDQRRVLDRAMENLAAQARTWTPDGAALMDIADLAGAERDTVLRLLADTLRRLSGKDYAPRFSSLVRLHAAIIAGTKGATLGGCLLRSDGKTVRIEPEARTRPRPARGMASE